MTEQELAIESVSRLFRKFTLPAVVGFIIGGIQIIIDGYFIGNVVGSPGLASVTLVYPLLIVMIAIALLLGTGSAALVALELGKGNRKQAHKIASDLYPLIILTGGIFALIGLFFSEPLLTLIGAKGTVFEMANIYLKTMFFGAVFFIAGISLESMVRNDGRPTFVMIITALSASTNIILDYFFVMKWGMGMQGAAIATILAFAIPSTVHTYYFFSHHAKLRLHLSDISPDIRIIASILKAGFPAFVMQTSLAVLVFSYNHMLLVYGTEIAVSSYGVIQYSFSIIFMIFEGISAGVQPIIGYNYGAKLYDRVYTAMKMTLSACFMVGLMGFSIFFLFPETIIRSFNPNDPELLETAILGMRIFMSGLVVEGMIIAVAVYFQSVNKVKPSLFIQFGKIFLFILPLLFILPRYYGLTGVWLATPIGQYLMFVVVTIMFFKEIISLQKKNEEKSIEG